MAPLPINGTSRLWVDYITGSVATSQEHSVMWRFSQSAATPEDVQQSFYNVINAWGAANFRTGWQVLRVRTAAQGSDFSVPVTIIPALSAFRGTGGASGYAARWEAVESSVQMRSLTSGRRGDFSLYRAAGDAASDFRYGMPGAVYTQLQSAAGLATLVLIDGTAPSIYPYVNENYNSYWELEIRN